MSFDQDFQELHKENIPEQWTDNVARTVWQLEDKRSPATDGLLIAQEQTNSESFPLQIALKDINNSQRPLAEEGTHYDINSETGKLELISEPKGSILDIARAEPAYTSEHPDWSYGVDSETGNVVRQPTILPAIYLNNPSSHPGKSYALNQLTGQIELSPDPPPLLELFSRAEFD